MEMSGTRAARRLAKSSVWVRCWGTWAGEMAMLGRSLQGGAPYLAKLVYNYNNSDLW